MAKKKRRKAEVMLSCTESGVPGITWSTTVEFRTVGHQIEVWATLDIEEELAPVEELVGTISRPFKWRAAAQLLASSYHGSLGGNFFSSVFVHGLGGMEADVLALAWMHSEEWPSGSAIAAELLKLDDAALEELHTSERDFVTAAFVEGIDRLVSEVGGGLPELIPYCAQAPDEPLSLAVLQGALERWRGDEELRAEQRAVLEEARSARLASVQDQIDWMVDRIVGPLTYGRGGPGNGAQRTHVQRWIEEYWLEHGSMPEGSHDLDFIDERWGRHIGKVDFSALSAEVRRTISGDSVG